MINSFRFDDLRQTSYCAWAERFAVVIANWSRRSREAGGKARERLETPLAVVTFETRLVCAYTDADFSFSHVDCW